jgi:hypothetical protein
MSRAGAIAGAVFDTNGAPMRGMSVELRRYTSRDGTPAIAKMPRILMVVGGVLRTGLTDEQGRYRIFGIPPGDYVVVAAWPPGDSGAATATPEDVARARADARAGSSQPQGGEAGRIGSIGGKAAPTPAVPLADPALEVFYPGTTNPSNAERVHISTGSDIPNRDIHLVAERGARVTGTVRLESGTVKWNWSIALARTDIVVEQHPTFRELDRFTASNLPAGRYAIIGRTWSATRDPETHLWGRTDVEVGTDDIDGVELVLRPTAFLRARVVVGDGNSQPGSTPLLVRLERADPGYPPDQLGFTNVGVSRVEADGTLTLVGIAPGRYRLALVDGSGESVPWVVRSISIDGVDLVDNILDVARGGSLGDAVIRVGAR